MPDVNLIFRAHLSLLRWGQERLAQETGDADELAGEAASRRLTAPKRPPQTVYSGRLVTK